MQAARNRRCRAPAPAETGDILINATATDSTRTRERSPVPYVARKLYSGTNRALPRATLTMADAARENLRTYFLFLLSAACVSTDAASAFASFGVGDLPFRTLDANEASFLEDFSFVAIADHLLSAPADIRAAFTATRRLPTTISPGDIPCWVPHSLSNLQNLETVPVQRIRCRAAVHDAHRLGELMKGGRKFVIGVV